MILLYRIWFLLWIFVTKQVARGDGHYKCTWYPFTSPSSGELPLPTTTSTTAGQCTDRDSSQMTSYVNHCTRQSYVPLMSCNTDGMWNCQSFISMCKTLIRHDDQTTQLLAPKFHLPMRNDGQPVTTNKFNPNENYFTMKEMGIAVVVSFIAGATMLTIVILVVWRYSHRHQNADQRLDTVHHDAKRMAALHAITYIASAFNGGSGHDAPGNAFNITNPNYAQVISSNEILDDVLYEHDRVYEDILTRRKSSCAHTECLYAIVERNRRLSYKRRNNSQNSLRHMVIDESSEQAGDTEDGIIMKPLGSPSSNKHQTNDKNSEENIKTSGFSDYDVVDDRPEASNCDSGYMEEIYDSGIEFAKLGANTDRKESLRM